MSLYIFRYQSSFKCLNESSLLGKIDYYWVWQRVLHLQNHLRANKPVWKFRIQQNAVHKKQRGKNLNEAKRLTHIPAQSCDSLGRRTGNSPWKHLYTCLSACTLHSHVCVTPLSFNLAGRDSKASQKAWLQTTIKECAPLSFTGPDISGFHIRSHNGAVAWRFLVVFSEGGRSAERPVCRLMS